MQTILKNLKERYEAFKAAHPKARIREAAKQLGVSEAELVACGIGETAIRLQGDFREILKQVPSLGYVMALTRNDHAVHERKGVYEKVSFNDHVGLVLGEDIDLRLFMMHWAFGFAVNENERLSLQFFDKSGEAVHKIYLTEKSDREAFEELVEKYRAADSYAPMEISPYPAPEAPQPDATIDLVGFRQAWLNMKDTHEFFGILKKYKVSRTQGLRLAPEGYAWEISFEQVGRVFRSAAEQHCPIMIFAGNRGCIQIHTGFVRNIVPMNGWFNVLDPEFNLHLKDQAVTSAWVVLKPTEDGIVTGIELYDSAGQNILLMFGKRKPGIPEQQLWREIVAQEAQPLYA
jgi:putative hemin transport protein